MRVDFDDDAPVVFKEINPVTYSALLFEEVAELTEEIFEAFTGQSVNSLAILPP